MIARLKSFLSPQTQVQMYRRIIGILCACIALVFVALLLHYYQDVRSSSYFTDGETVLKLSRDNIVTIYRSR